MEVSGQTHNAWAVICVEMHMISLSTRATTYLPWCKLIYIIFNYHAVPQKLTLNGIVYGLLDVADEFQGTNFQIKLNMAEFVCCNLTQHHKKFPGPVLKMHWRGGSSPSEPVIKCDLFLLKTMHTQTVSGIFFFS